MQVKVKATVADITLVHPFQQAMESLHVNEVEITIAPGHFPGEVVTPEQIQKLEDFIANLKAARGTLETAIAGTDQPKP